MKNTDSQKLVRPKVNKILYVVSLLILLNLVMAAYLAYEFYIPNPNSFCNVNSLFNCIVVSQSEYAVLFGLPIALWGVLFYSFLLILAFGVARTWKFSKIYKKLRPNTVLAILRYLTYFGLLFSLYLTYIEAFVIYIFCPLCVAQQVLIIAIVVLLIIAKNMVEAGLKKTQVCEFC